MEKYQIMTWVAYQLLQCYSWLVTLDNARGYGYLGRGMHEEGLADKPWNFLGLCRFSWWDSVSHRRSFNRVRTFCPARVARSFFRIAITAFLPLLGPEASGKQHRGGKDVRDAGRETKISSWCL